MGSEGGWEGNELAYFNPSCLPHATVHCQAPLEASSAQLEVLVLGKTWAPSTSCQISIKGSGEIGKILGQALLP